MKRTITTSLTLLAAAAAVNVVCPVTAPAQAAVMTTSVGLATAPSAGKLPCNYLYRTYTSGSSKYAIVGNRCRYTIYARPTVPYWPDPNCAPISAYSKRSFRTGGILSPTATGSARCA